MKILFLNLLMTISLGAEDTSMNEDFSYLVEDDFIESIELMISDNLEEKVKIMDAEGNVIREILKSDFNMNSMNAGDYKMLSQSSEMFDYLGDTYYLLEE